MHGTGNWRVSANCRNGDPDRLFVTGAKQRAARSICRNCPVLTECLAHALDRGIEFGVWGGRTERERRAMLRQRPDVDGWEDHLRAAARVGMSPVDYLPHPVRVAAVQSDNPAPKPTPQAPQASQAAQVERYAAGAA